jgi:hypothetical protein
MKLNIDLAQDLKSPCIASVSDRDSEIYYPSFHFTTDEDPGLPREGVMAVRYCLRRSTTEEMKDGKHSYSYDVEVEEILSAKGEGSEPKAPARSGSESADALDKLAEMLYKHEKNEGE